jgi:N-acetyl-anhydromuramyl-L-alanine amidase AmpD
MAFIAVKVIDKTATTAPNVHGGRMGAGDPDGIVLHHTGSKNEAGDESYLSHYHPNPVSINQLVRRDGTIVQLVANDHVAWHAGLSVLATRPDCNAWCIGIEICNDGAGEKFTDAQYEAVSQTVAYNTARYKIPDLHVSSHARVALPAGRKNDPKGYDWARMWERVDELRAGWPAGWPTLWFDNGMTDQRVMST